MYVKEFNNLLIETSYTILNNKKKYGMVIQILANPLCILFPLRINDDTYDKCIELEVFL